MSTTTYLTPKSPDKRLLDEIVGAVLSLEYGAVTVKDGQVVRLERHEKLRLPNPKRAAQPTL